jgi:3',5'-cyclic AMP phosphodiesterase CpdA
MPKIIHLSDLHIGHRDCGDKFKQIIDALSSSMLPAKEYVIVITGDLVENASNNSARDEVLGGINVLKRYGYTVLVVPGNHDYGNGIWASKKHVDYFKMQFYGNAKQCYPKVDEVDDVVFIGLDSTAEELHWYDRMLAEGELGKHQLKKLERIIGDRVYDGMKKVVYLHHHPYDSQFGHQLKDSHLLEEVIRNKVDVLLFGHLHNKSDGSGNVYNGIWGIERAYNAGSATRKNGNYGFHRVMDLDKSPHSDYDAKFV